MGGRRFIYVFLLCLLAVTTLAVGTRGVFAMRAGPHVWGYGFRGGEPDRDVSVHGQIVEGKYSKYLPGERKQDTDALTGEVIYATINDHGFRGRDFEVEKSPGVTRIVTLGASSTFGYHDRDDETYPSYLEQILSDECPSERFEVINLGVPHLDARQIVALFEHEALPLEPDVVTFYEGINDARGGAWRAPVRPGVWGQLKRWLRARSLAAKLVAMLGQRRRVLTAAEVETEGAGRPERFVAELERLRALASGAGVGLFVVTQQAHGDPRPREALRGVTYADEIAGIRGRLEHDGALGEDEFCMLTHDRIMSETRAWASEAQVPLIDGIAALDARRDTLVSWVHLSPEGNRLLARAIADALKPRLCP